MPDDTPFNREPNFTMAPKNSDRDPNELEELSRQPSGRAAGKSVVAWSLVFVLAVALVFFALLAIAPLKQQLHEAQALLVRANHDNATLTAQVDALNRDAHAIANERDGLAQKVSIARGGPEAATAVREALEAEMSRELGASVVWVAQKEAEVVLTLNDTLLFADAEDGLTPDGEAIISRLSPLYQDALGKGAKMQVMAHADTTPVSASVKRQAPDAWHLSGARAASVVAFWLTGAPERELQFLASGAAASRPRADNAQETGRRRNRRVELILTLPQND